MQPVKLPNIHRTPFSVEDILDPTKFTRKMPRGKDAAAKGESQSLDCLLKLSCYLYIISINRAITRLVTRWSLLIFWTWVLNVVPVRTCSFSLDVPTLLGKCLYLVLQFYMCTIWRRFYSFNYAIPEQTTVNNCVIFVYSPVTEVHTADSHFN